MKLSKNFSLDEFTLSEYAIRRGIDNTPNAEQIENLRQLCIWILQPLRDALNKPVVISSGYRSPEVNAGIGGSKTSQHMKGQAADIYVPGMTIQELYELIRDSLPYDQVIQEFNRWVHVSYAEPQRKQAMYAIREDGKTTYIPDAHHA